MDLPISVGQDINSVLHQLFAQANTVLPGIIAALMLLSFGYILGLVIGTGVQKLLEMTKVFEMLVRRAKISRFMGEAQLTRFFGTLIKWYIFVLFLSPAADLIQLRSLSFFLENVALWIPNLIVAILFCLFGLLVGEYTAVHIRALRAHGGEHLARIAKVVILIFTAIMALQQIGVNVSFASNVVLIIVGGIMLGLALAVGIGFGLALKDEAKGVIRMIKQKF